MKRDFKGVWIPKALWLSKDLTITEKAFLSEIDSLDNEDGCFASNAHFAEFSGLSKQRCTEIIKRLEKVGVISIKLQRKGKQITKRVIRVKGYSRNRTPLLEKPNNPTRETEHPYSGNTKGNNTSINNTSERENRALDFLKFTSPAVYEAFLMQHKKQIKDFKKFTEDFNDTVDQEELKYTTKVINARLGKYARNWVANQTRFTVIKGEEKTPVYLKNFSA